MLELRNVAKWYKDSPVIRGVSFSVDKGEIVGVTGPSGSGKSVLLKLIGKVELPDSGCEPVDPDRPRVLGAERLDLRTKQWHQLQRDVVASTERRSRHDGVDRQIEHR